MALKGNAIIQLNDAKTGELVKEVEEDNIVTNALQDLMSINPGGLLDIYNSAGSLPNVSQYANRLPLCPNAIGGVLLFQNAITEDVNKYTYPLDQWPVGYASNDTDTTGDILRGNFNSTESYATSNGYRLVFDFASDRANGVINSVCLTSERGGRRYLGTPNSYDVNLGSFADSDSVLPDNVAGATCYYEYNSVSDLTDDFCFFAGNYNGYFYLIRPNSSTNVKIVREKLILDKLQINATSVLQKQIDAEVNLTVTHDYYVSDSQVYAYTSCCIDGKYAYIIEGNYNSSGDAIRKIMKIDLDDYSFTESTVTFTGLQLTSAGTGNTIVVNGYLLALSYDKTILYKIELANIANVQQIGISTMLSGSYCNMRKSLGDNVVFGKGFVLLPNFQLIKRNARTSSYYNSIWGNIPQYYSPFDGIRLGPYIIFPNVIRYYSGRYTIVTVVAIDYAYLATINNLSSSVEKTADLTMKIIYTLTME